jgi:hypothetical protein
MIDERDVAAAVSVQLGTRRDELSDADLYTVVRDR